MAASNNKKGEKGASGGPNSHIRARLAYLHKAATYLQTHQRQTEKYHDTESVPENIDQDQDNIKSCVPRLYINQMRGVALKTQQRLSQETKRSFCKRCDLLMIPGVTCTEETRNQSKDRQKPWADVLVFRCKACETEKRFPQNQKRTPKLAIRKQEKAKRPNEVNEEPVGS